MRSIDGSGASGWGRWAAVSALWGVCVVSGGAPAAWVAWSIVRGVLEEGGAGAAREAAELSGGAWGRLGLTLGVAVLIGALSAVLAVGPAWLVARRGRGGRWSWVVLLAPMLMPASLAYAGWGVLRGPLTPGAAWLEEAGRTWWPEAPVWAGRLVGVGGLVLWSWPVAMLAMAPGLARIDERLLEALRVGVPGWGGMVARARLAAGAWLCGAGVVGALMLGSAVPLHLAQIETDAIRLWRVLDQTGPGEVWRAWVGAWPSVVMAVVAGRVLSRWWAGVGSGSGTEGRGVRRKWAAWLWSASVWGLSVMVPVGLLLSSVREPAEFGRFWARHGRAVWDSVGLSGLTGAVAGVVVVLTAYGWGGDGRGRDGASRATRVLLGAMLVLALVPGVLVGSATQSMWTSVAAWTGWDGVVESGAAVVLAHVCRFGAVAMLLGVWLSRGEARVLSSRRALEGLTGVRGWLRCAGPGVWRAGVGGGLAIGLLSLYEIESTVIVQPAGVESLSRQLLSLLHFARDEELAVALCWLVGSGLLGVGLVGLLLSAGDRRGSQPGGVASEPSAKKTPLFEPGGRGVR